MKKLLFIQTLTIIIMIASVHAQSVQTKTIDYNDGNADLQGFLVYDDALKGNRPVVIVVHEWNGINEYTMKRCEQLARMGYLAFAADVYGKGVRPQKPEDAGKEAAKYRNNRPLMRQRMKAALAEVKKSDMVDKDLVAVIGYCFGGTAALELARSGAKLVGVVSFHGGLENPTPQDAANIKSRVLVCHGAIDPFVPKEVVDAFLKEMNEAKVDYEFIAYSNAVHAFTNPGAGNDNSKGAAYNKEADMRSWEAMKTFFNQIFND